MRERLYIAIGHYSVDLRIERISSSVVRTARRKRPSEKRSRVLIPNDIAKVYIPPPPYRLPIVA